VESSVWWSVVASARYAALALPLMPLQAREFLVKKEADLMATGFPVINDRMSTENSCEVVGHALRENCSSGPAYRAKSLKFLSPGAPAFPLALEQPSYKVGVHPRWNTPATAFASPANARSVTYVSGMTCHPCARKGIVSIPLIVGLCGPSQRSDDR
jgi:hypothetical protein